MKLPSFITAKTMAGVALGVSLVSATMNYRASSLLAEKSRDGMYEPDDFAIWKGSLNGDNELREDIQDLERRLEYLYDLELERRNNAMPPEMREQLPEKNIRTTHSTLEPRLQRRLHGKFGSR